MNTHKWTVFVQILDPKLKGVCSQILHKVRFDFDPAIGVNYMDVKASSSGLYEFSYTSWTEFTVVINLCWDPSVEAW